LTIPPTPGWPGVAVGGCGVLVFVGVGVLVRVGVGVNVLVGVGVNVGVGVGVGVGGTQLAKSRSPTLTPAVVRVRS